MIVLLDLLVLGMVIVLGLILVTQILTPAFAGRKLFPAFRPNPLRDEVAQTGEEVETLTEQNENLRELAKLRAARAVLEQQIAAAENKKEVK